MNFRAYQIQTSRTSPKDLSYREELLELTLGLVGETGELAEIVKKHLFHGHRLDKAAVLNEAGDILWYLTRMLAKFGLSLGVAAIVNIEKLWKRYPDGFSRERSKNREENIGSRIG